MEELLLTLLNVCEQNPSKRNIDAIHDILETLPKLLERQKTRTINNYEISVSAKIDSNKNTTHVYESQKPKHDIRNSTSSSYCLNQFDSLTTDERDTEKTSYFKLPRLTKSVIMGSVKEQNHFKVPSTLEEFTHIGFGLFSSNRFYSIFVPICVCIRIKLKLEDGTSYECHREEKEDIHNSYGILIPVVIGSKICWSSLEDKDEKYKGCIAAYADSDIHKIPRFKYVKSILQAIASRIHAYKNNDVIVVTSEQLIIKTKVLHEGMVSDIECQLKTMKTTKKLSILTILACFFDDPNTNVMKQKMKEAIQNSCTRRTITDDKDAVDAFIAPTFAYFEDILRKGGIENNSSIIRTVAELKKEESIKNAIPQIFRCYNGDEKKGLLHILYMIGQLFTAYKTPELVETKESMTHKYVDNFGTLMHKSILYAIDRCKETALEFMSSKMQNRDLLYRDLVSPYAILFPVGNERKFRGFFDSFDKFTLTKQNQCVHIKRGNNHFTFRFEFSDFKDFKDNDKETVPASGTYKINLDRVEQNGKLPDPGQYVTIEGPLELSSYSKFEVINKEINDENVIHGNKIVDDVHIPLLPEITKNSSTSKNSTEQKTRYVFSSQEKKSGNRENRTLSEDTEAALGDRISPCLPVNKYHISSLHNEVVKAYLQEHTSIDKLNFEKSDAGILCISETPETEKCNKTGHLAVTVKCSGYVDNDELKQQILGFLATAEQIVVMQYAESSIIFNGEIMASGAFTQTTMENLIKFLQKYKQNTNNFIGIVVQKNKDEEIIDIIINTQIGRPLRPMIKQKELFDFSITRESFDPTVWMEIEENDEVSFHLCSVVHKDVKFIPTPFGILEFNESFFDGEKKQLILPPLKPLFHSKDEKLEIKNGKIKIDTNLYDVDWISLVPSDGSYIIEKQKKHGMLPEIEKWIHGCVTIFKEGNKKLKWNFMNPLSNQHENKFKLWTSQTKRISTLMDISVSENMKYQVSDDKKVQLFNPTAITSNRMVKFWTSNVSNETIAQFLVRKGIIEYVDPYEYKTYKDSKQILEYEGQNLIPGVTYIEMHKGRLFGPLSGGALAKHMSTNRNLMSCIHKKQGLPQISPFDHNKMEEGNFIVRSQRPLVTSSIGKEECIYQNLWVLIGSNVQNMEDAITVNQFSKNAGTCAILKKTHFSNSVSQAQYFSHATGRIEEKRIKSLCGGYFLKDGELIFENTMVASIQSEKQIPLSKYTDYTQRDGIVTRTEISKSHNSTRVNTLATKWSSIEIGDKFASRFGQKGTVSTFNIHESCCTDKSGVVAHMCFNPNGLPSRKTPGLLEEQAIGKEMVLGNFDDSYIRSDFSFDGTPPVSKHRMILSTMYKETSRNKEVVRDGLTGQMIPGVYAGPVTYKRLKHLVIEKVSFRSSTGPITVDTKQPVQGRRHNGGTRFGSMELHALLGYGAHSCIKRIYEDKLNPVSEDQNEEIHCCAECGVICTTFKLFETQNFVIKDKDCGKSLSIRDGGKIFVISDKSHLKTFSINPKFYEKHNPHTFENVIIIKLENGDKKILVKLQDGNGTEELIDNPFEYNHVHWCQDCDNYDMNVFKSCHVNRVVQYYCKAGGAPMSIQRTLNVRGELR